MNIEKQIIKGLRKNNWQLVGPDDDQETWRAFVARVNDFFGQDDKAKNAEHRLQRVLIAAYGEVLYDAVSDSSHAQRRASAYRELNEWIYRRIAYRVDEPEDAEDLTQDVLELVHKRLDDIDKPRVFLAFVGQVIWRKLSEYYRKKKRKNEHVQPMAVENEGSEGDADVSISDGKAEAAFAELMVEEAELELIAKINECMPTRAQKQTKVLVLTAFGPFSPAQIAQRMEMKVGNVHTLLSRARKNFLKHCLELLVSIADFLDPTIRNHVWGENC